MVLLLEEESISSPSVKGLSERASRFFLNGSGTDAYNFGSSHNVTGKETVL